MLWLLHYTEVKILLGLWLLLVFYAAVATVYIRANTFIKVVVISAMFGIGYNAVIASDIMLGTPNFNDRERLGQLNGYSVFENGGQLYIAILLKTANGPETFAIPYTSRDEQDLQQSVSKWVKTGQPQYVRRKDGTTGPVDKDGKKGKQSSNKTGDSSKGGQLEFYEFNQNFLQPKGQQLEQP